MMNILIIEDEQLALQKIKRLLKALEEEFHILAEIKSVEEGFHYLESHTFEQADVIFSDIQLSDGLSFQLFEQHPTHTPIIFTTAYDEYALKAFRVSGIDYLLKPFTREDLAAAIHKYQNFKSKLTDQSSGIQQLIHHFQGQVIEFPHFISYYKDQIIPINGEEVMGFFIENQVSYALHGTQKSPLNDPLDKIEKRLPPRHFFRANRQHIIRRELIQRIESYFHGKLIVTLKSPHVPSVIISKEKSPAFKKWLES